MKRIEEVSTMVLHSVLLLSISFKLIFVPLPLSQANEIIETVNTDIVATTDLIKVRCFSLG